MIGLLLTVALAQAGPTWPALTLEYSIPIEGKQRVGSWEVQLQRLAVTEEPGEVLARFAKSFHAAGLFIPPPRDQVQIYEGRTSLTALDPITMKTYTVTVWRAETPGTQILTGIGSAAAPSPAPEPGLELLPASAHSVFRTSDEGHSTCTFLSPQLPAAVSDELSANAARAGYRGRRQADGWLFVRGNQQVEARIWREGLQTRVTLMISGLKRQ